MKWCYGITTIPERFNSTFKKTLESLKKGGFEKPYIFVDGYTPDSFPERKNYEDLGEGIVFRTKRIKTAPNWLLSIMELYLRNPVADAYALFQDDLICYKNIRKYIEEIKLKEKSYFNLYTFPTNQKIAPPGEIGWFRSNQLGKGALALIFPKDVIIPLLTSFHLIQRFQDTNTGWKNIDGGICTAMRVLGFTEYCHNPSLVQHTGYPSFTSGSIQPLAISFKGEEYDAMELLRKMV